LAKIAKIVIINNIDTPGVNTATVSYSASVVKINHAMTGPARCKNKIFYFALKKTLACINVSVVVVNKVVAGLDPGVDFINQC
jgi:hypothetical protein